MIQIYTLTWNFVKKNILDIKKVILIYKAKPPMMTKKSKQSLHILEDVASGVQVGDIKRVTI